MAARFLLALSVALAVLGNAGLRPTARAEAQEENGPSQPAAARSQLLDGLSWQLLASSYYMFNAHRVSGSFNDDEYPYADAMGFGLVFAGGDVAYRGEKGGLTLAVRWGQNVARLTEIPPVSLGYVTWLPCKRLTLDLGYYDAFIGFETENEWENPTFTRGIVYFKLQPFRHLGFRALIEPHDQVDITIIAANGSIYGTAFPSGAADRVVAPTLGAQIRYTPNRTTSLRLGTVTSPNGSNGNRNWQATLDLVASWTSGPWRLFVDGLYQLSRKGPLTGLQTSEQWGVSLSGDYAISDDWTVGARGEYYGGGSGSPSGTHFTVTGTVRYSPVEYLIITLEPRAEFAENDIFYARPFVTDSTTGETTPSLNQDWFFGFWVGITARIGN